MNLFQTVKYVVNCREAAELYGIDVNRYGKALCPFHNDRHPSLYVADDHHYSYGKSYCPSKAVPEEKLMQTAALVGHTGEITAITAHNDNLLEFTLKDGTNAVKRWQDRSRAESWTAEIRRAAGEKTRERKQHHAES